MDLLGKRVGQKLDPPFADWRPGDQRVFVCDVRKVQEDFGWVPKVSASAGVERLATWVEKEKAMLQIVLG